MYNLPHASHRRTRRFPRGSFKVSKEETTSFHGDCFEKTSRIVAATRRHRRGLRLDRRWPNRSRSANRTILGKPQPFRRRLLASVFDRPARLISRTESQTLGTARLVISFEYWKKRRVAERGKRFRIWSGRWESNPRPKLGKLLYCHCTTPALIAIVPVNWLAGKRCGVARRRQTKFSVATLGRIDVGVGDCAAAVRWILDPL